MLYMVKQKSRIPKQFQSFLQAKHFIIWKNKSQINKKNYSNYAFYFSSLVIRQSKRVTLTILTHSEERSDFLASTEARKMLFKTFQHGSSGFAFVESMPFGEYYSCNP